jgi:hypothetical protein
MLRVVGNAALDEQDQIDRNDSAGAQDEGRQGDTYDIAAYVNRLWNIFRNNRNQGDDPLNDRLLRCQRMFEGKYDQDKYAEIAKFGGSKVYARIVSVKCRGASALLREVYLGGDVPWTIDPQVDPDVPPEVSANIMTLVNGEVQNLKQSGQPIIPDQVHMRVVGLMHAAQQAARRNAMTQAQAAADKIDDILNTGNFYDALREFLVDLPLFPFACIKGPVVRMKPQVSWEGGRASIKQVPTLCWERVSPFNLYWTPGVSNIEEADIIERQRLTRSDLNAMIGVPGYDEAAIRGVLSDYSHGYRGWWDTPDSEQARNEGREDPNFNQSEMIDCLNFTGRIQGHTLLNYGVDPELMPDLDMDYSVQTWVIGRYTIKTQLNPSPRQRHPYFVTSFEKVPGTVAGHCLGDLLEDIQEVCNATLRSLVNNMAIASGPQVVINTDAVAPNADIAELYPWKRWYVINDPMAQGTSQKPVDFFQPNSNAQALMEIYQSFTAMADEASAIPKYLTGSSLSGGAGRTASGLSMLMGNAEKVLQTVASNIDSDVMSPLLQAVYDMIMLTDTTGILTGQEQIRVRGVGVAAQKDTERQKQLQFLQLTSNPVDTQIVGELGRARILRAIAQGLGLPDDIVPDDQTIQAQIQAQKQMQAAAAAMAAHMGGPQGGPPGKPGMPPAGNHPHPGPEQHSDNAPPVNSFQQGAPA